MKMAHLELKKKSYAVFLLLQGGREYFQPIKHLNNLESWIKLIAYNVFLLL